MIRTQIQLTELQVEKLKRLSKKRRVSMAQLIRTAVDQVVDADTDETASKRRKAIAVIGCFNSGLTDVSERHDDYLAEAYNPGIVSSICSSSVTPARRESFRRARAGRIPDKPE